MNHRTVSLTAALALALSLAAPAFSETTDDGAKILPVTIVSKALGEVVPYTQVDHPAWAAAQAVTLDLIPQQVQEPKLMDTSVRQITVRSLTSRGYLLFLLEWEDATKNDGLRSEKFGDGVGVEFPLSTNPMPDYRMGADDKPVCLMFWRAERQRARMEKVSFHDENYPNAWSDAYAFDPKAVGHTPTLASQTEREKYLAAHAAGNPAAIGIAPAVEELSARSWVRLTVQQSQDARGFGEWKNKRWRVVIARPLVTADDEDADFTGKTIWPVAFSVWDGGKRNAGPRKMVVEGWVQLSIEP